MTKNNPQNVSSINLRVLFLIFWAERLLIALTTLIACFLGMWFHLKMENRFEAVIEVHTHNLPVFSQSADGVITNVFTNFRQKINDEEVFNAWKSQNPQSTIVFADFAESTLVNGYITKRSGSDLIFFLERRDVYYESDKLLVRSEDPRLVDDYFSLSNFINSKLTEDYVRKAQYLRSKLEEINSADHEYVLRLEEFVLNTLSSEKVFLIPPPRAVQRVSVNVIQIYGLSLILGVIIGGVLAFIRSAYRNRDV